jgi:hypothetical protein
MDHKPCLYVSGPMSGYDECNFPAFNEAAGYLRSLGHPVVNPADFGADPGVRWADCLKRDLVVLIHCEAVVTLDGWEKSNGARLEVHVATELGIPVVSFAGVKRQGGLR